MITGVGEVTTDPEPTNYPSDFGASLSGASIVLDWSDSDGDQLPAGYIIFAGTDSNLPMPTDGTPVSDDMDLTDGSGAMNVAYGVETTTFSMVNSETTYYFTIYPYTNAGATIDYKTDGTAPEANETTPAFETVVIESENFDVDWGNWQIVSVVGAQIWDRDNTYGTNSTPCAKMSGYEGQSNENDDWLISPAMDFTQYVNETIEFQNAMNYSGPDLELKISTDYDGGGDPYSATWTTLSYTMSGGGFDFTSSGLVDLSEFNSTSVYIAFHYTSTALQSATWEIDDIEIKGDEDLGFSENDYLSTFANLYPNPTSGFVTIENTDSYFDQITIQSITGQTIGSYEVKGEVTKFDLSDLQNGIYFVTFLNSIQNQSVTKKLITQLTIDLFTKKACFEVSNTSKQTFFIQ
ncbi:MAG: choice-of-anchor J domain-containing protein [Bacteroidales bacterium]